MMMINSISSSPITTTNLAPQSNDKNATTSLFETALKNVVAEKAGTAVKSENAGADELAPLCDDQLDEEEDSTITMTCLECPDQCAHYLNTGEVKTVTISTKSDAFRRLQPLAVGNKQMSEVKLKICPICGSMISEGGACPVCSVSDVYRVDIRRRSGVSE